MTMSALGRQVIIDFDGREIHFNEHQSSGTDVVPSLSLFLYCHILLITDETEPFYLKPDLIEHIWNGHKTGPAVVCTIFNDWLTAGVSPALMILSSVGIRPA